MILVFGSINVDLVAKVATIPGPGKTVLAPSYQRHFGGKGANQAVAAARVSDPGAVIVAAQIGHDAFGVECLRNLQNNGIGVDLVVEGDAPTGCAFITVDAVGENAITVASGGNGALAAVAVPDTILTDQTILLLQMEVPFVASLTMARRTRAAGGRVVWNLAPVPADMSPAAMADLIEVTDFLVVNEHEAVEAAIALGFAVTNFEEAASFLARKGALTCVVTAGAQGAVAFCSDEQRYEAPAPKIKPIDTTGSGDTFVGILASMIAAGYPLPKALALSCQGATLSCLSFGAQAGMPRRRDLTL
jgi:ribokinase